MTNLKADPKATAQRNAEAIAISKSVEGKRYPELALRAIGEGASLRAFKDYVTIHEASRFPRAGAHRA